MRLPSDPYFSDSEIARETRPSELALYLPNHEPAPQQIWGWVAVAFPSFLIPLGLLLITALFFNE